MKYREASAALELLKETSAKTTAEYRRALFEELAKSEQKVGGLIQDVIKAQERTKLQVLTAPVDGVVQQLAVHTIGGVVTAAQPLAIVVPLESPLEIEAMIPNRDIGFVVEGQEAEIKVETFDFSKYGLLHGRVLSISQDAITRENTMDKSNSQVAGMRINDSKSEELVYSARVSLDRNQMQVGEKLVNLSPGMAVTIEIKTGSRRIINYLL